MPSENQELYWTGKVSSPFQLVLSTACVFSGSVLLQVSSAGFSLLLRRFVVVGFSVVDVFFCYWAIFSQIL